MALPAKLQQTLLPSEVFFLAEDEMVTIVPRQELAGIELIGVCYGRSRDFTHW
jgi:GINS complex subunit 2